jgi:low affinity Fe/Cu permease
MNANMKILQDSGGFQELAQFSAQIVGRLAAVGVIVVLVSVWALTESVCELSKQITRSGKLMEKNK